MSAKEIFGDLRKKLKFVNYSESGYDLITLGNIGAKETQGLTGVDNQKVYNDYYSSLKANLEKSSPEKSIRSFSQSLAQS